jgi:hypothetical protein
VDSRLVGRHVREDTHNSVAVVQQQQRGPQHSVEVVVVAMVAVMQRGSVGAPLLTPWPGRWPHSPLLIEACLLAGCMRLRL